MQDHLIHYLIQDYLIEERYLALVKSHCKPEALNEVFIFKRFPFSLLKKRYIELGRELRIDLGYGLPATLHARVISLISSFGTLVLNGLSR